jgi:hypothetical protein
MQHQMEGEILNRQSVSSKASPQALVMLGKAGMCSVERQARMAGMVAVKTNFWTECKGDMGNIDPYLKKASPEVVEVLGKAGAKHRKSAVLAMREEDVNAKSCTR